MIHATAKVDPKGRVSLPAAVRKASGIGPGAEVRLTAARGEVSLTVGQGRSAAERLEFLVRTFSMLPEGEREAAIARIVDAEASAGIS